MMRESLFDTNQLGANFLVMPPDYFVCAVLEWAIAREQQHEFVWYVESIGMDTYAAIGNVGNDAVNRRGADPELNLRQTSQAMARRLTSLLKLLQHNTRLRG
jgi:hypothetical protein